MKKDDNFDYETIQQNQDESNLVKTSVQIHIGAMKCTRRLKARYHNQIKVFQSYSLQFVFMSLLIGDVYYAAQYRHCDLETEQQCFKHFLLRNILNIVKNIALPSIIFGLLLCATLINIIQRKYLFIVLINLVLIIKLFSHEESLYNYSKLFNILLVFMTFLVFLSLLGLYSLYWAMGKASEKKKGLQLFCVVLVSLLISTMLFMNSIKTSSNWADGVIGLKLQEQTKDGQNLCRIDQPEKDWYKLIGNLQDISGNYYDCTNHKFIEYERSKEVLRKYIPQHSETKFLVFPRLQDIDYTYNRSYTQEFILKNIEQVKDIKDIPNHAEYILDTESLTYTINVNKNETLIKERAMIRKELEIQFKNQSRQLPKNIIVLYIDALSRMRLPVKLPKVFAWFEEFQQKHQNQFGVYQGMRAVSTATFTWHNMLAYLFGIQSSDENIFAYSPYTLLEQATVAKNVSKFNPKLGKNTTTKVLDGKETYHSFVDDFKNAGYITALTNTDCATNPITQESISNVSYLAPVIYDHMGMIHACDPNYFDPNDNNNLGAGPYAIVRRCLYGKEMIDYSIEYAQQFMSKYQDQPKFLEMEFIEAHEGTGEVITHMDDKFYKHLKWLEDNSHLEDSVFVFLSDHGMHLNNLLAAFKADIMYTEIGFPIQILLYSNKLFSTADKQSLEDNQQKMTTMFEMHYFYKYLVNATHSSYFRENSIVSDKIPPSRSSFDLPIFGGLPLVCKKPFKQPV